MGCLGALTPDPRFFPPDFHPRERRVKLLNKFYWRTYATDSIVTALPPGAAVLIIGSSPILM